jgi:hypothetical protein
MFVGSLLFVALALTLSAGPAAASVAGTGAHGTGAAALTQGTSPYRTLSASLLLMDDSMKDRDDHDDHDGHHHDPWWWHRHHEPHRGEAPSPTPEPATAVLAGVALLIGGGVLRLRRMRKQA